MLSSNSEFEVEIMLNGRDIGIPKAHCDEQL